jgi:hypothetical protein
MSELINYSPDLKQRKIGVRESFESKCTFECENYKKSCVLTSEITCQDRHNLENTT